ncbi:hypothetical protein DAI22_08g171750 [Oryza sativa Japonica Group]|nr:hypothetical protein DAI22_08g171750 [Oryza sativa Japonica Group]
MHRVGDSLNLIHSLRGTKGLKIGSKNTNRLWHPSLDSIDIRREEKRPENRRGENPVEEHTTSQK